MNSISEDPPSISLQFDLDGDGVADVLVEDTNGHTVYVNVKFLILLSSSAIMTIVGIFYGMG